MYLWAYKFFKEAVVPLATIALINCTTVVVFKQDDQRFGAISACKASSGAQVAMRVASKMY